MSGFGGDKSGCSGRLGDEHSDEVEGKVEAGVGGGRARRYAVELDWQVE